MAKNLMDMLAKGLVLGDGGMFLEANWRGYDVPEIIGTHPEALLQIHRDFFNAGSQALQARTWFTSGAQLGARYGWEDRMEEINRTAIQAAKEASGGETPVGGCLVSTKTGSRLGDPLFDPDDPSSHARAQAEWEKQIAVLVAAGADFLIPETFFRLDEICLCLESCKKTDLPVMVLLGMGSEKRTHDGATAAECARVLADGGADIVGTVCIGNPEQMLPTALEMRDAVDIPIACQPKGFTEVEDPSAWAGVEKSEERGYDASRSLGSVTPDGMAEFALKARAEGINYTGGCCGTGPSHIRAMAEALAE